MIDILIPTLARPHRLKQTIDSIQATAETFVNIIIYVDSDDEKTTRAIDDHYFEGDLKFVIGGKRILSECWNELFRQSAGRILFLGADDIIFETHGWDLLVIKHFKQNLISLLYGDDCWQGNKLSTHPFISRAAANILGYFVPPYFEADGNDVWLQEVYKGVGRYFYEPRIITRHLHRAVDEKYNDSTYELAVERRKRSDIVWNEKKHLIKEDIEKLKKFL